MAGKILVIGATGTVGAPLLAELIARGQAVKGATRSESPRVPAGVEAVHLDLADQTTFETALVGVDRIYVMEPSGGVDALTTLSPMIEAAANQGIKIVLQSAMGVDADDSIPLRQVELLLETSGVPHVILRPNWFVDNFVTYWSADVRRGMVRLPAGDGKTSFIDARDIAAAAAVVLTTDVHDGHAYVLTGQTAHSYTEALDLLSEALGRRVSYLAVDSETFVSDSVAHGLPLDYAKVVAAIFDTVAQGWAAEVTDAVTMLTGKPPRSLKSSIRDLCGKNPDFRR